MAADKRTRHGAHHTVTKVRRIRGHPRRRTGDSNLGRELVDVVRARRQPDGRRPPRRSFDSVRCSWSTRKGVSANYDSGSARPSSRGRFVAIGSGRDFALMAMHLGKSAFEAVRLTCELSIDCGNGIDALELVDGSHKPDLHVVGSDAPQWE
jgi:hypothetical protein